MIFFSTLIFSTKMYTIYVTPVSSSCLCLQTTPYINNARIIKRHKNMKSNKYMLDSKETFIRLN